MLSVPVRPTGRWKPECTDIWRTWPCTHVIAERASPGQWPFRWKGRTVCKTVGSAYVGSNPTPVTDHRSQYPRVSAAISDLVPATLQGGAERSANRSL